MSLLYLDIETVPADDTITDEDIANAVPKNYTKKETIDKWIKENKDAIEKSIIKKRSLNPYECKIVCLSYSFDRKPVQAITGLERIILEIFEDRLKKFLLEERGGFVSGIDVIGHNLKAFDAPILFLRAAKYNLDKLHQLFYFGRKRMEDTMEIGSYFAYGKMVSLDTLCNFFDIPTPKAEMDGSKVYDAYKNGQIEEVSNYCNKDVEALISLHERMTIPKTD